MNGEERAVRNQKISKKSNMEPGNATNYEAEARSYFDSLRRPFEQTLEATRKNRPKLAIRIMLVFALIGIGFLPFSLTRVVIFVFHQNTYTFLGKPHAITEAAGLITIWCLIGIMVVGSIVHSLMMELELKSAVKPLPQQVMVFALSYAILRELESFEHSKLPLNRQTVIELWAKLLTYLRWTLQGSKPNPIYFHRLPPSDYPIAPQAELVAKALNWNEIRKTEYDVIVALNNLHSKVSPRLKKNLDNRDTLPRLKMMFQGIGNFFYTSIVQSPEDKASWGYSELLRAAEIVNSFSPIMEQSRVPFLSAKVFTHTNIAVAFLAWWIAFQTLFLVLTIASFRFFPTLTMNSQALVALIAAPIAAAISMVGISRKSS